MRVSTTGSLMAAPRTLHTSNAGAHGRPLASMRVRPRSLSDCPTIFETPRITPLWHREHNDQNQNDAEHQKIIDQRLLDQAII